MHVSPIYSNPRKATTISSFVLGPTAPRQHNNIRFDPSLVHASREAQPENECNRPLAVKQNAPQSKGLKVNMGTGPLGSARADGTRCQIKHAARPAQRGWRFTSTYFKQDGLDMEDGFSRHLLGFTLPTKGQTDTGSKQFSIARHTAIGRHTSLAAESCTRRAPESSAADAGQHCIPTIQSLNLAKSGEEDGADIRQDEGRGAPAAISGDRVMPTSEPRHANTTSTIITSARRVAPTPSPCRPGKASHRPSMFNHHRPGFYRGDGPTHSAVSGFQMAFSSSDDESMDSRPMSAGLRYFRRRLRRNATPHGQNTTRECGTRTRSSFPPWSPQLNQVATSRGEHAVNGNVVATAVASIVHDKQGVAETNLEIFCSSLHGGWRLSSRKIVAPGILNPIDRNSYLAVSVEAVDGSKQHNTVVHDDVEVEAPRVTIVIESSLENR